MFTATIFQLATTAIQPNGLPGAPTTTNPNPTNLASGNELQLILGIVFGIVGALALLMIAISGLRYVTSAGDPQKASQAKNGLVYSLVGLGVALLAEAAVAFVVGRL